MNRYCLGFAFGFFHPTRVLLIRKEKPDWQKGRYNGIGGAIEAGETLASGMSREFREECGIETARGQWLRFALLSVPNAAEVFCFATVLPEDQFKSARSLTTELVKSVTLWEQFSELNTLPNLRWLVPMAHQFVQHPELPRHEITVRL